MILSFLAGDGCLGARTLGVRSQTLADRWYKQNEKYHDDTEDNNCRGKYRCKYNPPSVTARGVDSKQCRKLAIGNGLFDLQIAAT